MNEPMMTGTTIKCSICENYVQDLKTFTCKHCRKSHICLKHLDREFKTCSSCATEERIAQYKELVEQGNGLKGFLRLMQFIFLLMSILFISSRLFKSHIPEFVINNVLFDFLYIWGACAAIGTIIFYFLLSSHKAKVDELHSKIYSAKRYSKIN